MSAASSNAQPSADRAAVPSLAVLVFERHQVPRLVHPGIAPGVLEHHQGERALRLGLFWKQLDHYPDEPDRLVAEALADQAVTRRGRVPLVEER